ncbi:thiamine-phosphate kinase [Bacillaceae bacterium SIJ1]|uniref:thiamine-phosphate kinase n=1 Tax=Litoribacterium kuwaitense TaxID=1398745 RepID=UPI0013EA09BF|nr:thiamine-phosphate kinase [Litoribacterium kuwaitense]NGP46546.1 thiamine-phosphate kinase [Litoribacterium kuwaitense]
MDEFKLIRAITPDMHDRSDIEVGIGDDAAIVSPEQGKSLVVCQDQMVEEIHFADQTMTMHDVGYKALAANLSDCAAMGGWPAYYMVTLMLPKHRSTAQIVELYKGMDCLAKEYKIDLIGGDTTSGPVLSVNVTLLGYIDASKTMKRASAQHGDVVFVTGFPGESAAGLDVLLGKEKASYSSTDRLIRAHQRPRPRLIESQWMVEAGCKCANDISDGVASEAWEIAEASQATLWLDETAVPFREPLSFIPKKEAVAYALAGGEDYELMGTIPEAKWPKLQAIFAQHQMNLTCIGHVHAGRGEVRSLTTGERLPKSGYNHFNQGETDENI